MSLISGAGWSEVSTLMAGEALVGSVYILIGYTVFLLIEKRSTIQGTLDAI